MKTIKYTLGIIAIVVTFSSCTVDELELANAAAGVIVTAQTPDSNASTTDSSTQNAASVTQVVEDIDPPTLPTKP